MKKLFNHTKRPIEDWKGYREDDYDWDSEGDDGEYDEELEEEEQLEEEVRYYEEEEQLEEEVRYYEEEEQFEEEARYYEEEEQFEEEARYYEEEEQLEEEARYYEEEEQFEEEARYYEEEGELEEEARYYEEEGELEEEAQYNYEEEESFEEEIYYPDGCGEEERFVENRPVKYSISRPGGRHGAGRAGMRSGAGFWHRLQAGVGRMGTMDRVILCTGVGVLVLALITGSLYVSARMVEKQVDAFASVGSQLDGIDLIGEHGLVAVADAELARKEAAEAAAAAEAAEREQQENVKDYNEAEYDRNVTVSLSLTSVQKDLKIKFINQSSGKLIPNVPFAVTVTDPSGKSVIWSDDDMDGIIYKKDITPGSYTVAMEVLTDEKYVDYEISTEAQKVEVKKDIAYRQVDVSNEIKKESEINAAKEDTKQNVTVVESVLQDTVEWAESRTIEATYSEVSKSTIPDPATLALGRMAGMPVEVAEVVTSVSGNNPAQGLTLDKTEASVLATNNITLNASVGGTPAAAPAITAVSSDSNVASVSVSGSVVTVTGVSAGSASVTVSYTVNGQTAAAVCQVTVKAHPRDDKGTKLKDAQGNQLYVLEGSEYREAVYADYYTAEKFFVRGGAKYTGWQTLDGKVYYFTASGEKVTGEQVIQGARYNFASDGSLVTGSGVMGIDVSKWNGNIDWKAVSNSGISYVIIRCGYRGSSQGKLIEDPKFTANIKGATAAGLKVGVYFFTQAVDEVEAVEEASMVLEQIKGYTISYPIFLDVEPSGGRADSIDRSTRTAVCRAFCETIQSRGYTAGIYANKTWLTGKIDAGALSAYKIWLAQYAASPDYTGKYDLWQYKSNGTVSGIKGKVDLNLSYLGY